ncbi:MAG: hypothetical protein ACFFA4_00740 [Promethearchaeota archaeon]
MSIYYFRTLLLGSDPDAIHFYISRAFGEPGEDKEFYLSWYKELNVLDNKCDLEIDALTNISANLDEIIPTVDGIIYFLNPTVQEESELFEMILPDIFSVKRDIPTIIMFYDQGGILPISVNDLLTHVWVNFPSLEAFVNLPPNDFHQPLQSLCLAMINGDTPLNIENAWMRFPIFIQMANIYFNNKNYFYAAQAIRKAAQIADIYNKEEFFIISEQAAYIYSKMNLFLEASRILEKVDKRKSINFKQLYAEEIIREGTVSFKGNEYEKAAKLYERAAQWASIEFLDKEFINEAFRLAINSWISACSVGDAFRILYSLPHEGIIIILKEISDKICAGADYLVSIKNFELAKDQLYRAVNRYQLEDLFDELKDLTNKLSEVLITLFKYQVNQRKKHAARNTYEEIENMWSSYKVKRIDLDSILEDLILQFFEVNNFEIATILIDKLSSRKSKQHLAKVRDELEDKYRALKKKEVEDYINKGVQEIRNFAERENEILIEMNSKKMAGANKLINQNNYIAASNLLEKQADYLKSIGKDEVRDQILTKSLDILLDGLEFENFFIIYNKLSVEVKTQYLTRIFPKYLQKLKELRDTLDYHKIEKIFESSIRKYRDQDLYDQSKEISLLFKKFIKAEALRILETEDSLITINKAEVLIKKVLNIASAYLDKEENIQITFNKIYKKITEIYIELDNLHLAHVYNDKIEKQDYKTELHKKIEKLEAKKSEIRTEKAKEIRKGEELKEKDSIIEKRSQEARLDKENDMKERKGLKRGYFKEALNYLKNQEYDPALEVYKNSMNRLNLTNKYKLGGVSLAIASLILMKQNRFNEAKNLLTETQKKLTGLGKLFSETFAVTLIEYVIDLKIFEDEEKFKKSLTYFENLPLFEEELALVNDLFGKEHEKDHMEIKLSEELILEDLENKELLSREEFGEQSKLQVDLSQRYDKLQMKAADFKRDQEHMLKKRSAMIKRYYSPVLEQLKSQNYDEIAKEYLKLANKFFTKIKDFETSSLMMILHGLALLKAGEPLKLIKNNINAYLNSLGVNKKLVEETFYIMLIFLLIDVRLYNFGKYMTKIKEMLKILPLFEEEKTLI